MVGWIVEEERRCRESRIAFLHRVHIGHWVESRLVIYTGKWAKKNCSIVQDG